MTITILMKQTLKVITAMRMGTTTKAKMSKLIPEKKNIKIKKNLKQTPPKKRKKKPKGLIDYMNS